MVGTGNQPGGVLVDVVTATLRIARAGARRLSTRGGQLARMVTPAGWAVTVAGPVALYLGHRLALSELIVLGYCALSLTLTAVLYLRRNSKMVATLVLAQPRVAVGESVHVELVVTNTGAHRSPRMPVQVSMESSSGDRSVVDIRLPTIASRTEFRRGFTVPAIRRGVYQLGPVRSVRSDPAGLVRREAVWGLRREFRVHPAVLAVSTADAGLLRDLEGKASRIITASDVAFHAVREYLPGDERRNIHWRSSAKTGVPMVRQFEETRRSRLVVALSLATEDFAADEPSTNIPNAHNQKAGKPGATNPSAGRSGTTHEFELAVSCAGSLGLRALRADGEVEVVVGAETPEFSDRRMAGLRSLDSRGRNQLLDALAGVHLTPSSPAIRALATVAAERVERVSVAYLVCGSTASATAIRAAAAQFSLQTEVIVVVCDLNAVPARQMLAGMTVLRIGYLEDLRVALAAGAVAL